MNRRRAALVLLALAASWAGGCNSPEDQRDLDIGWYEGRIAAYRAQIANWERAKAKLERDRLASERCAELRENGGNR